MQHLESKHYFIHCIHDQLEIQLTKNPPNHSRICRECSPGRGRCVEWLSSAMQWAELGEALGASGNRGVNCSHF